MRSFLDAGQTPRRYDLAGDPVEAIREAYTLPDGAPASREALSAPPERVSSIAAHGRWSTSGANMPPLCALA
jgi:hypothetical protein